jgi:membrane-bound metal-dependent hydrolase YbcI (DUF457 family)
MALPIAHATAGYLVYEAARPSGAGQRLGLLAAALVLANAPDLDFVPGLLAGRPEVFHRGVTHTLGATVVIAAAAFVLARLVSGRPGVARRAALVAGAAWGSHLLLDYFTADAVPPSGARFLWPLSNAYWISPVPLLREVLLDRTSSAAFLHSLLTGEMLTVWTEQIALFMCAVAAVRVMRALGGVLEAPARSVTEEP